MFEIGRRVKFVDSNFNDGNVEVGTKGTILKLDPEYDLVEVEWDTTEYGKRVYWVLTCEVEML